MDIKENNTANSYIQNHVVKNYYVASSTLVNVIKGSVVICNMNNLCCYAISEGIYFLKKGIKVGFYFIKSKEKPVFTLISIPAYIINNFCSGFNDMMWGVDEIKTQINRDEWIMKSEKITCGHDVINKIKNIQQNRINIVHSAEIIYSFYYILSHFIIKNQLPYIIKNSSEYTLKETVYNSISNNLSKEWTLGKMASHLCLSSSSLKRKLQEEDTTFSEIYVSARMNAAAKLLRKNKIPVQKISQMCGYENHSYFITVFKKFFNTTPKKYMKSFNK
ncbi:TPA: helix-turn-helix domain-containing protein [Escherichia coli]|nr:helix-turn-helix domain-containing protein [Escherichia coli]HAV8306411.1 helix-turn-helix domain-containing protein [Escherichia coli]HAV8329110.1 helix-turn-helix domain-containing protein [Escherichia coli]HAW0754716.1 helix-turn-helix domain-containing protein [Escherichia coli]HAW2732575.1 helix-turn-helix domain-containing protein [Escherichia coli]